VFPYIGIELVTVTAFEAANPADLRWATKNIAYVILFIYGITIGGIAANVEWFDKNLLSNYSQNLVSAGSMDVNFLGHPAIANQGRANGTSLAPVIAVLEAGASYRLVASILLGFLVYSALSCANANLYVASRTLYGITRDLDLNSSNFFESFFAHLNVVTPTWRVPLWSIISSIVLVASWLPFVKLGLNEQDVSFALTFKLQHADDSSYFKLCHLLVVSAYCLSGLPNALHSSDITGGKCPLINLPAL
jgi:amino acid transporter